MSACLEGPTAALPAEARERVEAYVRELLRYNERTNVYSKSAYQHLPFHVQDSVALGQHIAADARSGGGVLDLGSGSGLPSAVLACVLPELPVYAVESKSRKTRFLSQACDESLSRPAQLNRHRPPPPPASASAPARPPPQVARKLSLPLYTPLTQNVHEFCSAWVFNVGVVTAKVSSPDLVRSPPISAYLAQSHPILSVSTTWGRAPLNELARPCGALEAPPAPSSPPAPCAAFPPPVPPSLPRGRRSSRCPR